MKRVIKKLKQQQANKSLTIIDKLMVEDAQIELDYGSKDKNVYSVVRDVYNLLNSRCYAIVVPNGYTLLESSILRCGLYDYTSSLAHTALDISDLTRQIRWTIERFEPRLTNVIVKPVEKDLVSLSVSFEIIADLDIGEDINVIQLKVALDAARHLLTLEDIGYG